MTGIRRSAHRSRAGHSGARTLLTLAALLASFLQAFAVQTHVHVYGLAGVPAYTLMANGNDETPDDIAHASVAHEQTLCVVCHALASSGRALAPDAPLLALVAGITSEATAIDIRQAPRVLAHAWQSRAPPIAL